MPTTTCTSVSIDPRPQEQRSVFPNYGRSARDQAPAPEGLGGMVEPVECADLAFSRCFVYQFLARAYDYPAPEAWAWFCDPAVQDGLKAALSALESELELEDAGILATDCGRLIGALVPEALADFHDDYISAVGHASRGSCPINEIEYGDLKADPLFQPHRLADLAAFYRAFGVEVGADAGERQDHLAVELEFMAVLTAQQANLLNTDPAGEGVRICRAAQAAFMRDHLGRWLPGFVRRLSRVVGPGALQELSRLTLSFVRCECRRLGVSLGSVDLMLRPVDAGAALCENCGLNNNPTGTGALPSADSTQGLPSTP